MTLSFIAGLQGSAFHKIDGMTYTNVSMTLNVQNAFRYFAKGLLGFKDGWKNGGKYSLVLLSFSVGGFIGTQLSAHFGEKTLWLSATILLGILLYVKIIKIKNKIIPIDPK